MPDWNLKLNYAEGYRNPPLSRMDSNGEGLTWGGNPDLIKERSRSVQGEVNAVLLRSFKSVKRLSFRVDYAYTWIYDLITNISGINVNSSNQGAHTVELLLDLMLSRDSWFSVGYTFLDMTDDTYGKVRTIPNGWGTIRSYINLWNRQLYLSNNLSIFGSCEDFNRYPRINAGQMLLGDVDANNEPVRVPVYISRPSDLSVDRIRPVPIWNAGLRFLLPGQNLRFDADFYNLLDATSFYPEGWMDLTTYWNSIVNPRPGFAFFLKMQYTYN
jgi:hypothetical protein